MLSPLQLRRVFGEPDENIAGLDTSGSFSFEDSNLDGLSIAEDRHTELTHGLNRDKEYYEKSLKWRPQHRRYPAYGISEFWDLDEPKKFKIYCGVHTDYRKFKAWIRMTIRTTLEGKPDDWELEKEL